MAGFPRLAKRRRGKNNACVEIKLVTLGKKTEIILWLNVTVTYTPVAELVSRLCLNVLHRIKLSTECIR